MAWYADYSAGRPTPAALKAADFSGVLRYIGLGSEGKQINAGEYVAMKRAGMQVLLVAERGLQDAWGGYALGVQNAREALADARFNGIPDSVPIAAAADAHAVSQQQISRAVDYARAFSDVLGKQRAGFYGFVEVLNAVHAAGVVSWYWRCGSEPSAAEKKWVHFWQRNKAPTLITVQGVPCDINEVYLPVGGGGGGTTVALSDADVKRINDDWDRRHPNLNVVDIGEYVMRALVPNPVSGKWEQLRQSVGWNENRLYGRLAAAFAAGNQAMLKAINEGRETTQEQIMDAIRDAVDQLEDPAPDPENTPVRQLSDGNLFGDDDTI